jgi:hypothetical protein
MVLPSSERDDLIHRVEHLRGRAAVRVARSRDGVCRALGTPPDGRRAARASRARLSHESRRSFRPTFRTIEPGRMDRMVPA